MKKNKKLVPKRRFKEFENDGEWEQYNIKDIFKITRGDVLAATKTTEVKTTSMPYPVYSSQTKDNGLMGYYKDFLYEDAITWTTDGANAGTVSYRQGKFYCTNVSGVLLSDKGYANKMVSESINKVAWKHVSKVGNPKLMNNVMREITISIPNKIDEQNRIANFLTNLDKLISHNQNKIKRLKDLKSGYLTGMFPKEGEKYPKRRFEGFTEPWEQYKLGDIVQITMGQSPSSENYTENPDDYILVQGNADMKNGKVVPRVWTTQITKQAEKSDLILSVRAPVGDIGKTDYDVVLGRGVAAIKGNDFIYQTLSRMKVNGYWSNLITGSTFESINSNDIRDARIAIPSEEEQIKIGNFFKNLDAQIDLEEQKLNKLEQLKEAYLNELFV